LTRERSADEVTRTRRVLLLSTTTGYQLRSFGDAAAELGIELVLATDRCHALDDPWRDGAVAVRFHDPDASLRAILGSARTRPIDGVLAVGDRPVGLASLAAEALGLPGNPPEAARASGHKRRARECLAAAGLPVPWFTALTVHDDIVPFSASVRYPVVIKPAGLSGSRGVIRADTAEDLVAAFRRIKALLARPSIRAERTGAEADLLIEGFIEGREYAIEGVLTEGRFTPLALFDKPDPLDGPFFEETIYVTPSTAPDALQADVIASIGRAAAALGLRHGPVHAECRVNAGGVFVLEVAARPIGGLCSKVVRVEDASGDGPPQSIEHLLLRHAIGQDVSHVRRERAAAAVMMIPIPRRGLFKGVRGEAEARRVAHIEDVRITAKADQLLEPLPEAGSYLGFIFARAPEPRLAEAALREAHRRLTFVVDPAIDVTPAAP
jgi:biotin carboxylase